MIKYIAAGLVALFTMAATAAEITPYGTFNYKWSNDEDSSGNAYNKLEDNGSKIGIDIDDIGVEGQTVIGFAKLEVGVDTDDSGSDTFDSRLAYVGMSANNVGDLSVGRQSHPFTDNVATTASIFEVYGGSSSFSHGTRSSNSIAYSNTLGQITVDALGVVDGSSGKDGVDSYEWSASVDVVDGVSISGGLAADEVNDIYYYGVGMTTEVSDDLSIASSYTMKDAATDLTAWEVAGSFKMLSVGYGDKEGTGTFTTVGLSHDLSADLKLYAETEMVDNEGSAVDTQSWSIGTKFSF
tara:strand:+ start:130 stop:1017 length:888 start_codon:yes stop_codon:yes gene_type:complete